jgi:hypothetical protein
VTETIGILLVGFVVIAGLASGLVMARRSGEIPPGLAGRLAVTAVFVGVGLSLTALEGMWAGLMALGLGTAAVFLPRAFIPEARETQWHWPSVILGFVVVPLVVAGIWLAFTL